MLVKIKTILGAIAVAVLFFFGIIFAIASTSVYTYTRLTVAVLMFIAAFVIAYYISRQPTTIIQKVDFSGQMQTVALKCPNCSASIDANRIKMISSIPYATCSYCGHTFQVTEEPKW